MRGPRRLRGLRERPGIVVAPGACDAVSARLVEQAGFDAVYVGSYATAASRLGLPDTGLVGLRELVDHAAAVVGAVERVPVIAEPENGFGTAATVWRAVQEFERAGVAGIHLEDHEFGKHLDVPGRLTPRAEMVEKIRAALEARRDPAFVIIARTDAGWLRGGGGLDEAAGVKLVLYYSLLLLAAHRAGREVLADFRTRGDRGALAGRLTPATEFDDFIGCPRIQALAARHGVR
jgi:2-methylisocitrate lyase-like PEP mutase family enzyme